MIFRILSFDRWWPLDDTAPWPESDVHSLNTGGTVARCGMVSDRNYDLPKNNKGTALTPQIQATYTEGQLVDFDVTLTIGHKGTWFCINVWYNTLVFVLWLHHLIYSKCILCARSLYVQGKYIWMIQLKDYIVTSRLTLSIYAAGLSNSSWWGCNSVML